MTKLREVTGAHHGLGEWTGQLLSALLMILLLAYLLAAYAIVQPAGHQALTQFVGSAYVRVPAVFLALLVAWHAWLGGKSILMDYIKWNAVRVAVYIGVMAYLFVVLIWFIAVVWGA